MDEQHGAHDSGDVDDLLEELARARSLQREADSDCPSRELLERLRAHSLSARDEAVVVRHLADCAVCRDHLACLDVEVPGLPHIAQRQVFRLFRPRTPGWAWLPVPVMAAVAALLLTTFNPFSFVEEDLPGYVLGFEGYARETRGETLHGFELPVYGPGSDLVLLARPKQGEASTSPTVVAYIEGPAGVFERFPVDPVVTITDTGLIELRVRAGELLGDHYGRHKIRLLLLPHGTRPPERLNGSFYAESARLLEGELDYRAAR